MDLQALLSPVIALLGIAATVWLAASARRGARHHVDNIKLAAEALEKLRVHSPSNLSKEQSSIELYIREQETKLIDALDPDERLARRLNTFGAVSILVAVGSWAASWWIPADALEEAPGWISWGAMVAALIVGIALFFVTESKRFQESRSRRRSRKRLLKADYLSAVEERETREGNPSES